MTGRVALGVDPGYRATGIVAIADSPGNALPTLLANVTIQRGQQARPGQSLTDDEYLDDVAAAIRAVLGQMTVSVAGVEDVVTPTAHMGVTNPTGIIATAVTLGDVLRLLRTQLHPARVVRVRPAKNGSQPAACYPPELLDRGGLVRPAGNRRHERSAFDVARQALRGAA